MLRKLDVDLESYEGKADIMKLFDNLDTLKNLKSLKFNFDSSRINNKHVIDLCNKF